MGAMQRNKGAAAERTVAGLISDWTGYPVHRNWQGQAAQGGSDLAGVPGWSIEVKAAKKFLNTWWDQTLEQAMKENAKPALVFLIDNSRRGQETIDRWRVILPIQTFTDLISTDWMTAEISLRTWLMILSEQGMKTARDNPGIKG